jgi:hypothetical protein
MSMAELISKVEEKERVTLSGSFVNLQKGEKAND